MRDARVIKSVSKAKFTDNQENLQSVTLQRIPKRADEIRQPRVPLDDHTITKGSQRPTKRRRLAKHSKSSEESAGERHNLLDI